MSPKHPFYSSAYAAVSELVDERLDIVKGTEPDCLTVFARMLILDAIFPAGQLRAQPDQERQEQPDAELIDPASQSPHCDDCREAAAVVLEPTWNAPHSAHSNGRAAPPDDYSERLAAQEDFAPHIEPPPNLPDPITPLDQEPSSHAGMGDPPPPAGEWYSKDDDGEDEAKAYILTCVETGYEPDQAVIARMTGMSQSMTAAFTLRILATAPSRARKAPVKTARPNGGGTDQIDTVNLKAALSQARKYARGHGKEFDEAAWRKRYAERKPVGA